jgi:hypothetical protein
LFFKGGDAIHDADLGGGVFSAGGGVFSAGSGIRFDHPLMSESGGTLQLPTAALTASSAAGRWAGANLIYQP